MAWRTDWAWGLARPFTSSIETHVVSEGVHVATLEASVETSRVHAVTLPRAVHVPRPGAPRQ